MISSYQNGENHALTSTCLETLCSMNFLFLIQIHVLVSCNILL